LMGVRTALEVLLLVFVLGMDRNLKVLGVPSNPVLPGESNRTVGCVSNTSKNKHVVLIVVQSRCGTVPKVQRPRAKTTIILNAELDVGDLGAQTGIV